MASTKVRALVGITRLLVGLGVGYGIYYMWSTVRISDPWYYPIGAGLVCAIMASLLLEKLKGGGD
jgi:hypothetical protein